MAGGNAFAMDACGNILRDLIMAGSARLREFGKVQGGIRRTWRKDGMAIMAIAACRRICSARFQSDAVHTGGVTFGLWRMAAGTTSGPGGKVVVRMFRRDVRMATGARVREV